MIDMNDLKNISNQLWIRKADGKSYDAAMIIMDAIELLAEQQNQIESDLKWIKRKLNNEI